MGRRKEVRSGDLIQSSDASRRRRRAPRARETKVLEPISSDSWAAAFLKASCMSGLTINGYAKRYDQPWAITNHTMALASSRTGRVPMRSQPFMVIQAYVLATASSGM